LSDLPRKGKFEFALGSKGGSRAPVSGRPLKSRLNQLETLYRTTILLNTTLDSGKLLRLVVKAARKILKASSGTIMLLEEEGQALKVQVATGPEKIAGRDRKKPLGEGVPSWVVLHGKPMRSHALDESLSRGRTRKGAGSQMAAPLLVEGKVIGVIAVDHPLPNAYSEADQELLVALAAQASKVIQNARLYAQLKQRAKELETLLTVGQTIVSSLELKEVLERIVREAVRLTRTRLCSLMLLDETGQELAIRAVYGSSQQYIRKPNLQVLDSLLGQVVLTKEPLSVLDVKREPRYKFSDLATREGLCSLLSVPLLYEANPIGVLNVYTVGPHVFQQEEVNVLMALASLSAIAIEKARLYEKVMVAEEYVQKYEKFSLLGGISAEVAHEIRNPMTVINMLVHSMERDMGLGDPRRRDVEIIRRKLAQANQMVTQLLDVTRSREPEPEHVDINQLLQELLSMMRHRFRLKGIAVVTRFDESRPKVRADRLHLEQAFLNLIFNATEAMPEGGTLTVTTRILTTSCPEDFRRLAISIRDTGVGISQEQQKRLFEPFFTLRPMGVGLGLSIVQRVVKDHQGVIRVKSKPGRGSQFLLEFPLV
jgi:signal transduction histidine kinase